MTFLPKVAIKFLVKELCGLSIIANNRVQTGTSQEDLIHLEDLIGKKFFLLFPWFHMPTTSVIFVKNPTWKPRVHNFHRFLREWDPDIPPECQCGGQSFFETEHIRSSGHLFVPLLGIFPYAELSRLNLQDCTWPTSQQWMEQGQNSFAQWRKRWRLPSHTQHQWNLHLHLLWQEHERHLQQGQDNRVQKCRRISTEIRMLRRYVLCPADHHPHQTFISCPCHYHHLLNKT